MSLLFCVMMCPVYSNFGIQVCLRIQHAFDHVEQEGQNDYAQIPKKKHYAQIPPARMPCHFVDASLFRWSWSVREQGGESIHAEFNNLKNTFSSVVRDTDRMKMVVKQHCLSTLPRELAKVPAVKRPQA